MSDQVKTKSTSAAIEHGILDVIKERKSIRAFALKAVEEEKIHTLFEAARWAPSAANEQPWHYIYATREQALWNDIFETLNPGNQLWADKAPLFIVSIARKIYERNGVHNQYAEHDLGAANAFLSLQATASGLQVHQLGGYNATLLREKLSIPAEYSIGTVMAVGYPGDANVLAENLRDRERALRLRNQQQFFVTNKPFV